MVWGMVGAIDRPDKTLKKVLGRTQLTFEVLRTELSKIKCVIKDRSITYVSADIRDLQPLTPSQQLHGRVISTSGDSKADVYELNNVPANTLTTKDHGNRALLSAGGLNT